MSLLSIVIPVYNEGPPLKLLCTEIERALKGHFELFEIILVDDRSTDDSWTVMLELAKSNEKIKIVRLSRNFGQHSALTAGMSLCQGNYVVLMDCDGQDDPAYILPMYQTLVDKRCQIVYAKRKNKKHGFLKRTASSLLNSIMEFLSGNKYDPEIGTYRIMNKFVIDAYLSMSEKKRYIAGMFYWLNFEYATFAVEHQGRVSGSSTYNPLKLLKLARLGILNSSTKLLSLATYVGLISSLLSVFISVYFFYLKVFYNVPLGFTAIIVSVLFVGSIIMLLLGIIGEYLREIFDEVKARPNFIIEERHNF